MICIRLPFRIHTNDNLICHYLDNTTIANKIKRQKRSRVLHLFSFSVDDAEPDVHAIPYDCSNVFFSADGLFYDFQPNHRHQSSGYTMTSTISCYYKNFISLFTNPVKISTYNIFRFEKYERVLKVFSEIGFGWQESFLYSLCIYQTISNVFIF